LSLRNVMGVDVQGYADGRMSEAFLDIFCVPAGFEKLGGVGMAESMGGNGNVGIFGIASKKIAETYRHHGQSILPTDYEVLILIVFVFQYFGGLQVFIVLVNKRHLFR